MDRLIINYGPGAAGPATIASAAENAYELIWHCGLADDHARRMVPVLRRSGTVVTTPARATADEQARALRSFAPGGITTFCDGLVQDTALLAEKLDLDGNSPRAARTVIDKAQQRGALQAAGLQNLRFAVARSRQALITAVASVGAPAVVKPVHGRGSRNTFRVATQADLRMVLDFLGPDQLCDGYIVEEELAGQPAGPGQGIGDYVSVESVTVAGSHRVAGIVGRLTPAVPFRERGGFYPSAVRQDTAESAGELTLRALTALGISSGVTHTEVKLTPAGPEVLEVNGRLGGHVAWLMQRNGGPDLVRAALDAALSRPSALGSAQPDGVSFRHLPPAPMQVGLVTGISGVQQVRGLREVESLDVKVRRGTKLDWREGTGSCLAEIGGWAPTAAAMVACAQRAEKLLHVALSP
jgi:biotin carboxylase